MARKDPHIKFHDLPDNILPCPFCGPVCPSTAVLMIEERIVHSQVAFVIDCTNCGCTTQNGESLEQALEFWNTRPLASQDEQFKLGYEFAKK